MWKISKVRDKTRVVLRISGRIEAEELLELQMAVSSEERSRNKVDLDLENVRLVDQQVVTYLACSEASGTRLRNCPSYIREWINREKAGQCHSGKRQQAIRGAHI
jgi:anti-anti-sigma regulatory factor